MLRSTKITILILLLTAGVAYSQEFIKIAGQVLEEDSGLPVPGHQVYLTANDSLLLNIYITDQAGIFEDSLFLGGITIDFLHFMTLDCQGIPHDTIVYDLQNPLFVEFHICFDSTGSGCQADFITLPQGPEPFTIAFLDNSTGDYDQWFWNFGDSTYSVEQNPIHTYAVPGEYLVCLLISASNGLCNSMVCYPVWVTASDCEAMFEYITNPINPLEISFINLSAGSYSDILWDFGDGTFSNDEDPVHLYQEPGQYEVCLFISSADSLYPCFDEHCDSIFVEGEVICMANFIYSLDSLSSDQNVYMFYDMSTGDIDTWFWDFGDGNISFEQDPVHQYADSGQYSVCLTVSSSLYPDLCNDTGCKEITTPSYHNFGGLVWAGEYPLNNPVFSYDTGLVYLYRLYEGQWHFMDSKLFHDNGYYWFADLLEGNYLMKVRLTQSSGSYNGYFPTYFGDKVYWDAAQPINLAEDIYDKHVHLVPVSTLESGPGMINGYLNFLGNEPASMDEVHVILYSDGGQPLSFSMSDPSGFFSFDDLPLGTYLVRADVAGRPSEPYSVILTASSPISGMVELVVDEHAFFDIDEENGHPGMSARAYPNPVQDRLTIETTINGGSSGTVSIHDMMGRQLFVRNQHFRDGKQEILVDVSNYPSGIYLVRIQVVDHDVPFIIKFSK